ncbi:hypothetical protein O0I10_001973 [Lichtheimia ornata]|uniref:RNA methyltransferase n=1 Tax=Lichtheimia ornata TaxID=688661 RepID=A0AAD7VC84_9FUNG|nr:uncharacterized protein O0I10_001973 [Lichtheimia ornata]KAJ8662280.1 hypothetical protein O0I10_001973 [Lichtheimia ornata]
MSEKRPNPYLPNEHDQQQRPKAKRHKNDNTKHLGGGASAVVYRDPKKAQKPKQNHFMYGNYANYYSNRRNLQLTADPRLELLDASLFEGKRVLDIGCNSGNISITIAMEYDAAHVVGVDIDPTLINKAEQQLRVAYSLKDPKDEHKHIMDISMRFHYFPRSLCSMFGYIPMTLPPNTQRYQFPHNIKFEAADWMDQEVRPEEYDTILALSITKWIHIHRGDHGMKVFFKRIYKALKPNGVLVLEIQPFDTYERRAKKDETTMAMFESIEFVPDQFHEFLMDTVGFSSYKTLKVPEGHKGFERPLTIYTK